MTVTAVDTNILIDIFSQDATYWKSSYEALECASEAGAVIVAPVVVAEVASSATSTDDAARSLSFLDELLIDMSRDQLIQAGLLWRDGSRARARRSLPDYLIAVHAASNADRLLTRDKEFDKLKVPGLRVVKPSQVLSST